MGCAAALARGVGRRARQAIEIIRRVWAGERGIRFHGAYYRLQGAHGGPVPAHPMGIWIGAYGPRMLRLVGRAGDGWIPSLPRLPVEDVPPRQAAIDDAARAAGRDPGDIVRIANLSGTVTDGEVTGWLHGPVEHWVEELARLVSDLRFDGFVVSVDGDDVLGQTERFAAQVVPLVRAAFE